MSPPPKRSHRQTQRPPPTGRSARRLAFDVLTAWQQRSVFANVVLDELCRTHRVVGSDRALAMEMSYGVIRRQATIDAVLARFVDRARASMEGGLWTLLRVGAYQVLFLEGVPPHAAVNETVEVAKQLRRPDWGSVANGVLRSLCAAMSGTKSTDPAANRVPVDAQHSVQLDRDVFPAPDKARVEHYVKAHSYPRWLVRDWLDRFGTKEATRLFYWFNAAHPPTIRVNRLQQSPEVARQVLQAAGVGAAAGSWPEALHLTQPVRIRGLPGFAEGWWSVQDASAMAAARLLTPQPGESILDLCAAPGGKSTHLAELMEDRGSILAIDSDAARLQRVQENAHRLRLNSITCRAVDEHGAALPEGPFDRVLVDVPCSNTGVLSKRPEARWRIDAEDVAELRETQTRLLTQGLNRVKPFGLVVYATCSIDPRENQKVVERVLQARTDVVLMQEVEHRPGLPGDGGYQALLQRQ